MSRNKSYLAVLGLILVLVFPNGCSMKSMAINSIAGAMEGSNEAFVTDDDPELVGDAFPFLLKMIETLLLEKPEQKTLLVLAAQGFTSYAQAWVSVPASEMEEVDLAAARAGRMRAFHLFVRAKNYGLRALEVDYPDMGTDLIDDPEAALATTKEKDIPALFWTGAAWALAINSNKSDMMMVADFDIAIALLRRANDLDPAWNEGAAQEVMIVLEAATAGGQGGSLEAAREAFQRAMELSEGKRVGALVTMAESVSIKEQNLEEFEQLLTEALAFDIETAPEYRLLNIMAQQRAAWLMDHRADFFIDYDENSES
jgi:predicted anti-sigma-YlaC factor YlaD